MRVQSRSIQAITAQVIMMFAGMVYAWSVLSSPIAEEFTKWSKVQLSFTFTLAMITFCVGCMIGGFLNGKLKVQNYLICSGILFLGGFFMASRAHSLPALYLGFGLICGLASGLAYNVVISTLCCWYPEKQGFISGLLLMAFGFGSFIIGKLYQRFTPVAIGAWRGSFAFLGCIIFVVFIIGSLILRAPPGGLLSAARDQEEKEVCKPGTSRRSGQGDAYKKDVLGLLYMGNRNRGSRPLPDFSGRVHRQGNRPEYICGLYLNSRRAYFDI